VSWVASNNKMLLCFDAVSWAKTKEKNMFPPLCRVVLQPNKKTSLSQNYDVAKKKKKTPFLQQKRK